jgi:hypothetical protein
MEYSRESPWEIEAYSDSDFGGDKDGRKSISGLILLVSGVPISWRSKGQNTVSLSSTEAEYIALSEVVREVKFISQVLDVMKIAYKNQSTFMLIIFVQFFLREIETQVKDLNILI